MTSGRKLTPHQVRELLRLAGLEREDGQWLLTYQQIAEQLGVHRRTVYRHIRRAAVHSGQQTSAGQSHIAFSIHDN